MKCPSKHCTYEIKEGSNFCGSCGLELKLDKEEVEARDRLLGMFNELMKSNKMEPINMAILDSVLRTHGARISIHLVETAIKAGKEIAAEERSRTPANEKPQLMYEEDVIDLFCKYLDRIGFESIKKHPEGIHGPDAVAKDNHDKEVLIEAKGTKTISKKTKKEKEFDSKQNEHHFAVGLFQLMGRVKSDNQIGMLAVPYHPHFEKAIRKSGFKLNKLGFEIFYVFENGDVKKAHF